MDNFHPDIAVTPMRSLFSSTITELRFLTILCVAEHTEYNTALVGLSTETRRKLRATRKL